MSACPAPSAFHLHLVSDATGETINTIARACIVQFEQIGITEHAWNLIRTARQLDAAMVQLRKQRGLVLYTFVDEELRRRLEEMCRADGIPAVPILDPVLKAMASYFGVPAAHTPGRQHIMNEDYFARIDAMDFALAFDDGHGEAQLNTADVLLLGVSRSSKTPTCLYLANRGVKAANIPLIPGQPPRADLAGLTRPLIVGLTKDPDSLIEIRLNRLRFLGQNRETSYVDPDFVRAEVGAARRLFARLGCPVIDVTRRSIEETAAEILMLLAAKREREAARQPEASTTS